jgi:hypothetical protein
LLACDKPTSGWLTSTPGLRPYQQRDSRHRYLGPANEGRQVELCAVQCVAVSCSSWACAPSWDPWAPPLLARRFAFRLVVSRRSLVRRTCMRPFAVRRRSQNAIRTAARAARGESLANRVRPVGPAPADKSERPDLRVPGANKVFRAFKARSAPPVRQARLARPEPRDRTAAPARQGTLARRVCKAFRALPAPQVRLVRRDKQALRATPDLPARRARQEPPVRRVPQERSARRVRPGRTGSTE